MTEIKYRSIVDWNTPIDGSDRRTRFEAGFGLSDDKACFILGRIIDSDGVEIISGMNPLEAPFDLRAFYREWNPSERLANLIKSVEADSNKEEVVYFETPLCELTLEIRKPIVSNNVLPVIINMSGKLTILKSYRWQDASIICAGILCKKEDVLEFLRSLLKDLSSLLGEGAG